MTEEIRRTSVFFRSKTGGVSRVTLLYASHSFPSQRMLRGDGSEFRSVSLPVEKMIMTQRPGRGFIGSDTAPNGGRIAGDGAR